MNAAPALAGEVTRLLHVALLAVRGGNVYRIADRDDGGRPFIARRGRHPRRADSMVAELIRRGWIELDRRTRQDQIVFTITWYRLTELGAARLESVEAGR